MSEHREAVMKKRGEKKNASWWTYALTAVLVDAVVFAVRAAHVFREQKFDNKITKDNNIVDGGTIHD